MSDFRTKGLMALCCLLCLGLGACRDRPAGTNVEAHVLEQGVAAPTPRVDLTVSGFISCGTCQRDSSTMIVELWHHESVGNSPIERKFFPFIGAYEISARVMHDRPLVLKVLLMADGAFLHAEEHFNSPEDTSLSAVAHTIDLDVRPEY